MNNSVDVSKTIAPKSDQLNADDLVGGPITIKITVVWGNEGAADQPISIGFEGDGKRPYKPCKSMRRVLVAIWGAEGKNYVGKSLRLYCDPNVQFGGIAVGGIRISHASHIAEAIPVLLTTSRSKRTNFVVRPIDEASQANDQHNPPEQNQGDGQPRVLSDEEKERLSVTGASTAAGGSEIYKNWFMGLDMPERIYLTDTLQKDSGDFDKEKKIHDINKRIAAEADKDNGDSA